jgi:hypothetical protein
MKDCSAEYERSSDQGSTNDFGVNPNVNPDLQARNANLQTSASNPFDDLWELLLHNGGVLPSAQGPKRSG